MDAKHFSDLVILNKEYRQPSVFTANGLLREARRQKCIPAESIPKVCLLDPDGDLCRHLKNIGAKTNQYWACYHTEMLELETASGIIGVVGCAVGGSFAVLVAEQLFASGCEFLISISSAGQLVPKGVPPYFVLIDRALRDEGTSFHYLPPSNYVNLSSCFSKFKIKCLEENSSIISGGVWTTDGPYRETAEAILIAKRDDLLAVEMEAASLYAYAESNAKKVICFAHVTNQMATVENDFEKGARDGNEVMISLAEWCFNNTAIAASLSE